MVLIRDMTLDNREHVLGMRVRFFGFEILAQEWKNKGPKNSRGGGHEDKKIQ